MAGKGAIDSELDAFAAVRTRGALPSPFDHTPILPLLRRWSELRIHPVREVGAAEPFPARSARVTFPPILNACSQQLAYGQLAAVALSVTPEAVFLPSGRRAELVECLSDQVRMPVDHR